MKTLKLFFVFCSLGVTPLLFVQCGRHPDNPNPHMKGFPTGRMEYETNDRIVKHYSFLVSNTETPGIKSDQMLPDNYRPGAVLYPKANMGK